MKWSKRYWHVQEGQRFAWESEMEVEPRHS